MTTKAKRILSAAAALSALLAAFCVFKMVSASRQYETNKKEYDDLKGAVITTVPFKSDENDGYLNIDCDKLLGMNPDFKCWIDIPGTDISYPVVQSSDNDFYLRRTFEGTSNVGGVIFIDYRSEGDLSGRNTVIYGHRMNDGSMFAGLREYMVASFCNEHSEIHLYTQHRVYVYKVFSVSKTTTGSDCFTFAFRSDCDFNTWLNRQLERSVYDMGIVPEPTDRVITLVTCTGQDEWRYVVQAVLTDEISTDN